MQTKDIIDKLSTIELRAESYNEIKELVKGLFPFPALFIVPNEGHIIARARLNENIDFNNVKDLSYKPQQFNTQYQRASSPFNTIFYGSSIPPFHRNKKLPDVTFIGTHEICNLLKPDSEDGQEYFTTGLWEVTGPMRLLVLCNEKSFQQRNDITIDLYNKYRTKLERMLPEEREKSELILNFFSQQFSKFVTAPSDYMLSAIFTEVAIEYGYAGVLYPSVKVEGYGFNYAIAPQFADSCLRLKFVVENVFYKKGEIIVIDNSRFAEIDLDKEEFKLISFSPEEQLGIENIEQLLNGRIKLPIRDLN